jgi:gamma-glutamylcyclotransferase (GGCT)/AIG2-like uncharacterized protein YtfP
MTTANKLADIINDNRDLVAKLDDSTIITGCEYYETEEIKNIDYSDSNLNIIHINIRNMESKIDPLLDLLNKLKYENYEIDIVLICETFMNDSNIDQCVLPGFNMEYNNRKIKKQGGVAVYINNKLKYTTRQDLSIFHEGILECCFIELPSLNKEKNIIVGEVYRVPGTNENFFLQEIDKLLKQVNNEKKEIIIGTDQNMDFLNINNHTNTAKLFDLCLENSILPTITKPTRITHSSATLIDNIYLSKKLHLEYKSAILLESLSDHLPCLTLIKNVHKINNKNIITRKRLINDEVVHELNNRIIETDWQSILIGSVDEGYNIFDETLNKIKYLMKQHQKKKLK